MIEQWRAAVTRWGDPVLALALLVTDRRVTAEAAAVSAFARVLATQPPDELEHALYAALFQELTRRRRFPTWSPRGPLPHELARTDSTDRFVLGLWLLRGLSGTQIATLIGLSPQQVIERLARVLARVAAVTPTADDGEHLSVAQWLGEQLRVPVPTAHHLRPCQVCQTRHSGWQAARDKLQAILWSSLRKPQLSQASQEAIEELLTARGDEPTAWWQRQPVWLGALIAAVGLALALLVTPRGTVDRTQATPTVEARALVQAALDTWFAADRAEPVHQQVWARDPRLHNGEPVVTDLWLAEQGSARHRVEVRRGGQLVEWQVADGQSRVDYAAEPADSSCRWNTGWSGNYGKLFRGPQRFAVSAEEQRLVRDARLVQGAYGVGYLALQRALDAADLRSFGWRVEGKSKLVLLQFTDTTTEPARHVILRIDPATQQLHAVQEVRVISTQVQSLDLWRLELSEVASKPMPQALPAGPPSVSHKHLVDPGCPALDPRHVVSSRVLLSSTRPTYMPYKLPQGLDRIALLTTNHEGLGSGRVTSNQDNDVTLLMVGPGRWFSLRDALPASDNESEQFTRERWQVTLNGPSRDGIWNGQLRPRVEHGRDIGRVLTFWARGWSREEILTLIDTLAPFDSAIWLALSGVFLDARPLTSEVDDTVRRALQALQPRPHATIELSTTTKVRVQPHEPEPSDPYHIPAEQRFPATLIRHQVLQFDGVHIARYHDRRILPDGTLYELRQDDGRRFHWYSNTRGIAYTGDEALLRAFIRAEPADVALLTAFFDEDALITRRTSFGRVLLEQALKAPPADHQDFAGPAAPQSAWYGDLPIGNWFRQLWLDSRTYHPLASTITHRRPDGSETYIQATTITERRVLETPPPDMFSLNILPEDTFTIDVDHDSRAVEEAIEEPSRLLAWPATVNLELIDTRTTPSGDGSGRGSSIRSDWKRLIGVPATSTTTYGSGTEVVFQLTQGPRQVLRHVLRHQPIALGSDATTAWSRSERLRVEILGQTRDAWLLTDQANAVLVVEVDELLLHFSGPADYLRGPLLQLLPRLEWIHP